jgi:hypothetical protein
MVPDPTFTDNACETNGPSGSSFALPESPGVDYFVNAVQTETGTHSATDGSTITIIAVAQQGYTLTGDTSWSHTFAVVTNCAQVSPTHIVVPPASQPTVAAATTVRLASTGVPTLSLLLIAGLLALVGGAMCASGVRWTRS